MVAMGSFPGNEWRAMPVPWHQPRQIEGQHGYTWHYHSPDSDTRVVYRDDNGKPTKVGTVRQQTEGGLVTLLVAYTREGERLAHDIKIASMARLVALYDRACLLGAEAGKAGASWVFDGNSPEASYQRCVQWDNDGDPQWHDYFGPARGPLSGEYADDPTPQTLMRELDVDFDDDGNVWLIDMLCDAYTDAYGDAWRDEVLTTAHNYLAG